MGSVIVVIVLILAAWNAVRTMGRQKKRMMSHVCTGECKTCKTPCEAKRIYHIEESNKSE